MPLPGMGIGQTAETRLSSIKHSIDDYINLMAFVISGLTRNPVFPWIPAFEE